MSKATRMLAMTGMALVAGATMAAGPAAASSSAAQGATSATQQQAGNHGDRDREWVAGYYRSRLQCERVGRIGERFDRWDDYECDRVRRGFRTFWRLEVERDWHGGGHWNNGGGHWNNGGGDWNNGGGHDHDGGWNGHDGPRR